MSDIRMQSIFLDEEFVYIQEDKSDVDLYNSKRRAIDREKSQLGHNKNISRNEIKKSEEKEVKRAPAQRNKMTNGRLKYAKDGSVKHLADFGNEVSKGAYDDDEKSRPASHKGRAASRVKKESTLMDMIDII